MAAINDNGYRNFLSGMVDAGKMAVFTSSKYAIISAIRTLCSLGYGFCSAIGYNDEMIVTADRNDVFLLSPRKYLPRRLMKNLAIDNGSKSLECSVKSLSSFLSGSSHLITLGFFSCKSLEKEIKGKFGIKYSRSSVVATDPVHSQPATGFTGPMYTNNFDDFIIRPGD